MKILNTAIPGCFQIFPKKLADERGRFVKFFQDSLFKEHGLKTTFKEEYYSYSKPGVIRGLHFQIPPLDHSKIVMCLAGSVLDLVVDLRKGSPAFLQHVAFDLNSTEGNFLYIPKGCAHGFASLGSEALMLYKVETEYSKEHDSGVLWNSVGFSWPLENPVVSMRDQDFPKLNDFESPFIYV